jgi:diadenosine tetraphosphate (Ap4A) HIT family hydrolase
MEEYIGLQRLVYLVAEAVGEEVGAERMYIFTFGSNEGNPHVHWHVGPLPPGVPYEDQQGAWASWGMGVLKIPQEVMASLAARALSGMPPAKPLVIYRSAWKLSSTTFALTEF